jgi:hypothetical protein
MNNKPGRRKKTTGVSEYGKTLKITSTNPLTKTRKIKETETSNYIKNIEKSRYNPITRKSVFKEKQIEYGTDNSPRSVFISKEIVKRDKNNNWKSLSESKKLRINRKKTRAEKSLKTY